MREIYKRIKDEEELQDEALEDEQYDVIEQNDKDDQMIQEAEFNN